jgi:hypothetical protein
VALILKDQPFAVFEVKHSMSEFRIGGSRVEQHELATHSKMRYQGSAVIEIEKDMLAATVNEANARIV